MSYCTTDDLIALTGSGLDSLVLAAIIEEADRCVDAYLGQYGLTGSSSGPCKSASLKFSQAELLTRMRLDGSKTSSKSVGDYSTSDNIDAAISGLRKAAYDILDKHVAAQSSLSSSKIVYCQRVNGR